MLRHGKVGGGVLFPELAFRMNSGPGRIRTGDLPRLLDLEKVCQADILTRLDDQPTVKNLK